MRQFVHGVLRVLVGTGVLVAPRGVPAQTITVRTDVGVELVNALMVQNSPEFVRDSAADLYLFRTTLLLRESYAYFAPFRAHAAARRTHWLSDKLGTGVYLLPLFYAGFPHPHRHTPVSPPLLAAIHPNPDSAARIADAYMQLVGRFYQEACFARFQRRHRQVYALALAEVRRNLPPPTFLPTMERYYGAHQAGYQLLVNPFFKSQWGMAWQVPGAHGALAIQIAAPFGEQRRVRGHLVTAGFDNAAEVRNLSVHEFGHTFVNPLAARPPFAAGIAAHQALFRPIAGQPQYRDWETLFNEHLVRAGEIRLALALGQPAVSQQLRADYAAWPYLPFFEKQLQRYEANRGQYPTLETFMPELLRALSTLTP